MLRVEPNPRFEKPRNPVQPYKRPDHALNGRRVQPRLVHDSPEDAVPGLGSRKVPTSSQKPTRQTNVPIVYSRLVDATHEAVSTSIQAGDVVFVGRQPANTSFGVGTNRVSRVRTIEQMNAALAAPAARLVPTDPELLRKARKLKQRRVKALGQALDFARRAVDLAKSAGKTLGDDHENEVKRIVLDRRDEQRRNIEKMKAFDFEVLDAIVDWELDGVVKTVHEDISIDNDILPHAADDKTMLAVAVGGHCDTRNVKRASKVQFITSNASPGDTVYICLVANSNEDGSFSYKYCATSATAVRELVFKMSLSEASFEMNVKDLFATVSAYRLGRVVDTNASPEGASLLTVNVAVEKLRVSDFFSQIFHTDYDDERRMRTQIANAMHDAAQEQMREKRRREEENRRAAQEEARIYQEELERVLRKEEEREERWKAAQALQQEQLRKRAEEADALERARIEEERRRLREEELEQTLLRRQRSEALIERRRRVTELLLQLRARMQADIEDGSLAKALVEEVITDAITVRPSDEQRRTQALLASRKGVDTRLRPIAKGKHDVIYFNLIQNWIAALQRGDVAYKIARPLSIGSLTDTSRIPFRASFARSSIPPGLRARDETQLTVLNAAVTHFRYSNAALPDAVRALLGDALVMLDVNGIHDAMDRSQESESVRLDVFEDVCALYSETADGKLLERLCLAIARSGKFGEPKVEDTIVRFALSDEQKRGAEIDLGIDLSDEFELAGGALQDERHTKMSAKLNMLFGMPSTFDWTPSASVRGSWKRSLEDIAAFEPMSKALGVAAEKSWFYGAITGLKRGALMALAGSAAFASTSAAASMSSTAVATVAAEALQMDGVFASTAGFLSEAVDLAPRSAEMARQSGALVYETAAALFDFRPPDANAYFQPALADSLDVPQLQPLPDVPAHLSTTLSAEQAPPLAPLALPLPPLPEAAARAEALSKRLDGDPRDVATKGALESQLSTLSLRELQRLNASLVDGGASAGATDAVQSALLETNLESFTQFANVAVPTADAATAPARSIVQRGWNALEAVKGSGWLAFLGEEFEEERDEL